MYLSDKTRGIMVEIANPIYDVVFKYLMRDEKVAKLLLSAINRMRQACQCKIWPKSLN